MKVRVRTQDVDTTESVVVEHDSEIEISKEPDGGLKLWGYVADGDQQVLAQFAAGAWRYAVVAAAEVVPPADLPDNSEFDDEHPF